MAEHQGHDTVAAAAEITERQRELEESGQNNQQIPQDGEPDVAQVLQGVENINLSDEPETRADFLQHSRELTLDPNTANRHLKLSEGDRKAEFVTELVELARHPDRFIRHHYQVLSRETLTGRRYWEVEWRGKVDVAVAYNNISRKGDHGECGFGENGESWALRCYENIYNFRYNKVTTPVPDPQPSRVGVYLDHSAGILSFYSVHDQTMTLLHRVQTTFTGPLYAGLDLFSAAGNTAELCELK